jgi:glutathione synthase
MRIAFLVNRVETEVDEYATTRLAKAAALMGHEVWYVGLGDLRIGEPDGEIGTHARPGIARDDDTLTAFVDRMKESSAKRIRLDKLDAVFLRNDSIEDLQDRPWASSLGSVVGQLLVAHGVTVVNDPTVLLRAGTKVYLDEFPAEIRPRSLMTRNEEDVRNFVSSVGRSIIKPLCGAKGRNVFMVDGDDEPNLNQIMEAVLEDGYIYAQGCVDGAEEGDMRIFLLDGELIEIDGHIAAFRRVPDGNDPRANISTGGRMRPGDVTETTRAVVEAMRGKLVQDGMFFVGIDVIGDKVVEINAESPGGLQAIEHLYEVDICPVVIDALERRTRNGLGTTGVQPAAGTPTANG